MALSDLLKALRAVDQLLALDEKYRKAFEKLTADIDGLKERVTRLETREEIVVEKAKAAAGVAATQVAITSVSDIARRVGRLEERNEQKRLEKPE